MRSLANMVEKMGDEIDFKIVTHDRDFLENEPYQKIVLNEWNSVGKAQVYYASPGNMKLKSWQKIIKKTPHDILYLNSFFDFNFTIKLLILRKMGKLPAKAVILAPRGEFSRGALSIKKWKKKLYIYLANMFGIYDNVIWQASSEYEANDIKNVTNQKGNVKIAPNLPEKVIVQKEIIEENSSKSGIFRIIFLSRISPKKNIDFALKILSKIKDPLIFDVYGIIDDERYWDYCCFLIKNLPENISVHYKGEVVHSEVVPLMANYDLFLFPTRGENYGHVILEALSAGLPVLISDQTPWKNLQEKGVGWDLSLQNKDEFVRIIKEEINMHLSKRLAKRLLARDYATKIQNDTEVVAQNRKLFLNTIKASY